MVWPTLPWQWQLRLSCLMLLCCPDICSSFSAVCSNMLSSGLLTTQNCNFSSSLTQVSCLYLQNFFFLLLCGSYGILATFNNSCSQTAMNSSSSNGADHRRKRCSPGLTTIPCSLYPLSANIRSSLYSTWRRSVCSKLFDTQVPSVSAEELGLPRHVRCALSRLRCNGHSLLLNSYLHRIGRNESASCSACGDNVPQDVFHLILHCSSSTDHRNRFLGSDLSIYDLWSRP